MRGSKIHWDRDWRYPLGLDQVVNFPCRQCMGCNQATARDWSVRCFHEAQLHTQKWQDQDTKITTRIPNSSVVTLTYEPEQLGKNHLEHRDFQLFMKKLRLDRKPVRYFMCGEYGGESGRKHFHAVLFGESFDDRYESIDRDGQVQQHSKELDKLWGKGRATVDDFSFAGAAYVAGYVAKKSAEMGPTGPIVEVVESDTGEVSTVAPAPEYRKMSTHWGLGHDWLLQPGNFERIYIPDLIKVSEWSFHPPKYYDTLLARYCDEYGHDLVDQVKEKRRDGMAKGAADWSPERCGAAEQIALQDLQQRRDSL